MVGSYVSLRVKKYKKNKRKIKNIGGEGEGRQPLWRAPPSHLSITPPHRQGDSAREAGAVQLDDGASYSGAPKRTISRITFSRGLFAK